MSATEEPMTIDVCTDCVSLLANGEVTDSLGEDGTFEHAAKVERIWGDTRLTLGSINNADDESGTGGEPWLSHLPCKGCGNPMSGDRTYATAWLRPSVAAE